MATVFQGRAGILLPEDGGEFTLIEIAAFLGNPANGKAGVGKVIEWFSSEGESCFAGIDNV